MNDIKRKFKRLKKIPCLCAALILIAIGLLIHNIIKDKSDRTDIPVHNINLDNSITSIAETESTVESESETQITITIPTSSYNPVYVEPEKVVEIQAEKVSKFSEEERNILLKIGMSEAGCESSECVANVMRVILNRVDSDLFPNTIKEVVFQDGQFSPVDNGRYYDAVPNDKCYEALEMIENGWDQTCGALYFESCVGESWHSQNLEFLYSCDAMRFYK